MKKLNEIARRCGFTPTDVRPETWNTKDNCSGDCTTRALVAALNGTMTYDEVEAEQYRLAKEMRSRRNRTGVYDKILVTQGWRWIQLSKCLTRGEVAVRLKFYIPNVTALTLSRSHIAAVRNGELIDTWDSRGGQVYAIMVPYEHQRAVIEAMAGIECHKVNQNSTPKLVRSRKSRHRFW